MFWRGASVFFGLMFGGFVALPLVAPLIWEGASWVEAGLCFAVLAVGGALTGNAIYKALDRKLTSFRISRLFHDDKESLEDNQPRLL